MYNIRDRIDVHKYVEIFQFFTVHIVTIHIYSHILISLVATSDKNNFSMN